MTKHQLGVREAFEVPADDQAKRVRAGLDAPTPHRAGEHLVAFEHRQRRDRIGRVNVDDGAERVGAFPDRIEHRIVEITAARMAVDHRAAKFKIAHAMLEFVGGALRILYRNVGKTRVAVRLFLNLGGEKIIGFARLARRGCRISFGLHARPGGRQHHASDAAFVHFLEAAVAEIAESVEEILDRRRRQFRHCRPPIFDQAWRQNVFFKCDLLDHASSSQLRRRNMAA